MGRKRNKNIGELKTMAISTSESCASAVCFQEKTPVSETGWFHATTDFNFPATTITDCVIPDYGNSLAR
jgi:hypothetical protein